MQILKGYTLLFSSKQNYWKAGHFQNEWKIMKEIDYLTLKDRYLSWYKNTCSISFLSQNDFIFHLWMKNLPFWEIKPELFFFKNSLYALDFYSIMSNILMSSVFIFKRVYLIFYSKEIHLNDAFLSLLSILFLLTLVLLSWESSWIIKLNID